jgi:SAM-dependent methyltransferase
MSEKIKKLTELDFPGSREWYNDWVESNAFGSILDIGKSQHWDYSGISYSYKTLDNDESLKPDILADICDNTVFKESFDTVLCNGMYECAKDPQKMVEEVYRILNKGGKAIFGFVGKNYPPYKGDWKFYEKIDFNGFKILQEKVIDNYHFIICQKYLS